MGNSTDQHSLACASDCIATYRLQISIFTAVSLVFAVIGVDAHIYSKGHGAALATAAGWLILAIVDVSSHASHRP